VVGLALLTQPVVASIYGWAAFGEVLSGLDIAGMVLVGAALAVARARA
jgi:drug/metabolite transporter (DMT)-like permease